MYGTIWIGQTYSFLFFGPGFPLTFTTPSTAKLALFFPFFPSAAPPGGGIATESSVPLGTGVFPLDASPSASGDAVGALESESEEVVEDAGFEVSLGCSVFTSVEAGVSCGNLERRVEDRGRRIMRDFALADFLERELLPPLGVEGEALCALAMVRVVLESRLFGVL